MEELINKIDEFLNDYDSLEYPDHEDYINFLYDAVGLLHEAKESLSDNKNEISKIIISRGILNEYGYDGNLPSSEHLTIIADELMEYWQVSGGFKDALIHTMNQLGYEQGDCN